MAKPELGTKRVCPDTGRKFYDLNRDPIVSPYTGKSFPLSFFEDTAVAKVMEKEEEEEVAEVDTEGSGDAETVSLEEADEEAAGGKSDDIPDLDEDSEVELDDDDNDTFLESDDEEEDDVSGFIGGHSDEDEES